MCATLLLNKMALPQPLELPILRDVEDVLAPEAPVPGDNPERPVGRVRPEDHLEPGQGPQEELNLQLLRTIQVKFD